MVFVLCGGNILNSEYRVKSKIEFENIIKTGKKISDSYFVIYYKERGLLFSRFGISLSKKFGNAVKRNRYKRILREIIRKNQNKFKNAYDYIIIMKKNCDGLDYKVIENNLMTLLCKLEEI